MRVCSLPDTVLYDYDYELLLGNHWLNDTVISFWFEHLRLTRAESFGILMVDPAATFMLSMSNDDEDVRRMLDTLGMKRFSLVLLPINNNADPNKAQGGSHWSLLMFRPATNSFHHFDPMRQANAGCALKLCAVIARALGLSTVAMAKETSPQQPNSCDCGVFVCLYAEAVVLSPHDVVAAERPTLPLLPVPPDDTPRSSLQKKFAQIVKERK